jgi:DNA-binding NarL/FixJ family response regulator
LKSDPAVPPPPSTRILVVDDHPVVRQGLAMTLGGHPGLSICGEAANLQEALQAISAGRPDLVLSDLVLEGGSGLDLVKEVRVRYPGLPVLILSMHDEEVYAERLLRAGARGYLMKNELPDRIVEGIRTVLKGEIAISDRMKSKILGNLVGGKESKAAFSVDRLTDRELEIFRMIGEGFSTRKMAGKLSLSIKTIEAHIAHVKRKLGTESGKDLQLRAFAWMADSGPRLPSA